jgi:ABC-type bacteriocin/lantibiotic exporter with double-glycine peptidase domain
VWALTTWRLGCVPEQPSEPQTPSLIHAHKRSAMTDMSDISGLHAEIDGQEVLHGLALTIPEGEVHALLGPNGSGKTSLMMTFMGFPAYRVTQGRILLHGQDITPLDLTERARLSQHQYTRPRAAAARPSCGPSSRA